MKMKTILLAAILVVALVPATSFAAEVAEAVMCRDVQDRQPVGESDSFPADIGKVWCWSKIKDGEGTTITHAYYYGGEEKLAVMLPIGSPLWRTWSNKTLHPGSAGSWAVEARDPEGRVLARDEFTCVAE